MKHKKRDGYKKNIFVITLLAIIALIIIKYKFNQDIFILPNIFFIAATLILVASIRKIKVSTGNELIYLGACLILIYEIYEVYFLITT